MSVLCSICGKSHDLGEISLGADSPVQWQLLSEAERTKSELSAEQCVIRSEGKTHFFVRACLEIPIRGENDCFSWGVWVSLSEENYAEMTAHWSDPGRTTFGPYFGWLCTPIPPYPDTMFLKTMVHQRDVGLRPLVEIEPTEHPLALDQRLGISREKMGEMVCRVLHGM